MNRISLVCISHPKKKKHRPRSCCHVHPHFLLQVVIAVAASAMSSSLTDLIHSATAYIDHWTGISGSTGYILIFLILFLTHKFLSHTPPPAVAMSDNDKQEQEAAEPPRNFTTKQLAYFDGTKDEKTGEDKPVYLSVNGTVFDVSDGRNFYGPDGEYLSAGVLKLYPIMQ